MMLVIIIVSWLSIIFAVVLIGKWNIVVFHEFNIKYLSFRMQVLMCVKY